MKADNSSLILTGRLLIAMPGVLDDFFRRSVVLICAHTRRGAMGVLLNRTLPEAERATLAVDSLYAGHLEDHSFRAGGPAGRDRFQYLHDAEKPLGRQTLRVGRGLNLTPARDAPTILGPSERPRRLLITAGHCGWAAGQLEDEVCMNIWLTASVPTGFLFDCPPDRMWADAMGLIGVTASGLSAETGHA